MRPPVVGTVRFLGLAGQERGSVMLLGIGFVVVCLLAIAVVTDVSAAFLQRQSLMSVADAAALAGAQAIDRDSYYSSGAMVGTRLNPALVRAAAARQLTRSGAFADIPGLEVQQIATDGVNVVVSLRAPLRLTFFGSLHSDSAVVLSSARLDYRPIP